MANYYMEGKLFKLGETIKRTETFSNRSFILEVKSEGSNYAEFVTLEAINDNCRSLDGVIIGQAISCKLNIKGRKEKNGDRYFNSIEAWDIGLMGV